MPCPFAVGFGYDVHRLAVGLPLFLGGIEVPHTHGLEAHSDGDVVLHAICDALLGALQLGDIGYHFPPTDEQYRHINSKELLRRVMQLVEAEGYAVGNLDVTILAERPKIAPHIAAMRAAIGAIIHTDKVSIKATTTERLGFVGREEGIAAQAVSLLYQSEK